MPRKKGSGVGVPWLRDHVGHQGDACLIWPMCRDDKGYGLVSIDRKSRKASRVMCEMVNGPPPTPAHQAAHECGNGHEGCVHPQHLFWKTPAENQADAVRLGHIARKPGEPKFKLTAEQVSEIRALKGCMTQTELGLIFGVTSRHIGKIHRGVTWRNAA